MNKKLAVWIAVGLMVVGGLALVMVPRGSAPAVTGGWPENKDISNAELKDFVARGARLVDVRTGGEFTGGHIGGAENVPIGDVTRKASDWDKKVPVVVYCQTGSRSLNAAQYLRAQGFEHVYNLAAGVSGWDGALVQGAGGAAAAAGKGPALGRPVMYDFASGT